MHVVLTIGLALLGFAAASLAALALARLVLDVRAHRRELRETQTLGPFRQDLALRSPSLPALSAPTLLLGSAIVATWLVLVLDRPTRDVERDAERVFRGTDSSRIVAGDPALEGLGHVVRASAPLTGVGGTIDDDVLRIVAYGGVALDQVTPIVRVLADVDRAVVRNERDRFEIEIRFVEGHRPRWNAEVINDCLVLRIAR